MSTKPTITIIGGGPAGLMAAETAAAAGCDVTIADHMPSLGRKLLMAGRGGLNLTHSEPLESLLARYGAAQAHLAPAIAAFPPSAVIDWCHGLGQETFVGSSGRVFPRSLKASPLLRAWLRRLDGLGVKTRLRHRWLGPNKGFSTGNGTVEIPADATILALGGASWPRLGSDGAWPALLDIPVAPWQPSNCGFTVAWSGNFRGRFEGQPLKRIALTFNGRTIRGEALITATGLEGGAIYALSGPIRDAGPSALVHLDLRPDLTRDQLAQKTDTPHGALSLSNHLRKSAGLSPVAIGLVQEALHNGGDHPSLATLIKTLPLNFLSPAPIARAISSAGGLPLHQLDANAMLRDLPGLFAAGEMLDWEAPTGGYLLQACLSTGAAAANGAIAWLAQ